MLVFFFIALDLCVHVYPLFYLRRLVGGVHILFESHFLACEYYHISSLHEDARRGRRLHDSLDTNDNQRAQRECVGSPITLWVTKDAELGTPQGVVRNFSHSFLSGESAVGKSR